MFSNLRMSRSSPGSQLRFSTGRTASSWEIRFALSRLGQATSKYRPPAALLPHSAHRNRSPWATAALGQHGHSTIHLPWFTCAWTGPSFALPERRPLPNLLWIVRAISVGLSEEPDA